MKRQIVSEFRKLRTTRSVWSMTAGLLAIVVIAIVATVADFHPAEVHGSAATLPFVNLTLTVIPLFALLLGIRSFTDEYRFGSIVPTLLADPHRRRVLGAKVVATAVAGVTLATVALAVALAAGVPVVMARGADVTWSASQLAIVIARALGATALWTTIGVGIGVAVRHQVAAIAGTLVWMLVGEGIGSGILPSVAKYFPGAAGLSIVGINASSGLAPALGALVLATYALVATGIGGTLMARRDVT
jgi:ABC-type transport system involved in multi-copper enzyme maturation permease subunit